ncbi:hypothetical protein PGN35_030105 [Nodosilinea sp. PGN35]|uniref:hypothetical protein n=1 Tax=unclassified Nodosilinea TaxID=2628167 RepID=UPI000D119828|nr:hypothetical protein [Nodosilinea sp. TSF1-S3]MDF0368447.1 hypothetical protein [Nodosilinea sp. TSF1-S3]PSN14591.1 hypothetical protein C7293_11040 [filamentous cyanobacterium CCT1]PSN81301.1 hypothetical protein C8B47_02040 [filamentous cyanobacterium CCP4]
MTTKLTSDEIQQTQTLISDSGNPETDSIYSALETLKKHDGDLVASFQELWEEEVGNLGSYNFENKKLWSATLKVLRNEICGDEGFRSKILDYNKNPGSSSILTGSIVYLVGLTTLPINPAIATIIVLYILKVGMNIFCEYTEEATKNE